MAAIVGENAIVLRAATMFAAGMVTLAVVDVMGAEIARHGCVCIRAADTGDDIACGNGGFGNRDCSADGSVQWRG